MKTLNLILSLSEPEFDDSRNTSPTVVLEQSLIQLRAGLKDLAKLRGAFEAAFDSNLNPERFALNVQGEYSNLATQGLWIGWRAMANFIRG